MELDMVMIKHRGSRPRYKEIGVFPFRDRDAIESVIMFRIDNQLSRGEFTVEFVVEVPLGLTLQDAYERLTRKLTLALVHHVVMLTHVVKSVLHVGVGT
jgi:hypothetical protein